MGREEELGILIELVSVRAGASSEDGEPQRAFVSALAGSPQGPRSISPDPCVATLCQTSPESPPSLSSSDVLPSPSPPAWSAAPASQNPPQPCLPKTTTPRRPPRSPPILRLPLRSPSGLSETCVEFSVGLACSAVSSWAQALHPHLPVVFAH